MGWLPDQGFLTAPLGHLCRADDHVPAWRSVRRPTPSMRRPGTRCSGRWCNFGGIEYISGVAPLFIHQYAHAWCDYRDQRDRHTNYFTNSIAATRAHQLCCMTLGKSYPVDRPGYVGNYGVGFARRLPGVGGAAGDGPDGWHARAVRRGRIAAVPAGGVFACVAEHARRRWATRCGPAMALSDAFHAQGQLVCGRHPGHRPGDQRADGGEPARPGLCGSSS